MKLSRNAASVLGCAAFCLLSTEFAAAACTLTAADSAIIGTKALSEHTRILASDEFEGRAAASKGEKLTLAYLQKQFVSFGLQPGGDRGGWTQAVALRKVEVIQPATLRATAGAASEEFKNGDAVVFTSAGNKKEVSLRDVPVVFVGYGVSAPEVEWDDFKGVDLHGKIALMLVNDPDFEAPTPGKFGGKAMTYYGRWTYKFEEATRRGAAGVLIVHEEAPAAYGWGTVQNSWSGPRFDIVRNGAENSMTEIEGWVRNDVALQWFKRANLDFAAIKQRAMRADFKPIEIRGLRLTVQAKLSVESVLTHNVIAKLPGRERAAESVIYGAHWDHLGVGKPDAGGDRIYHGAVDNAIGVAGLLEVARAFAAAPPSARSIYFIAMAAEEQGLLGAEYYTANPTVALERTAAYLNMDVLGINGPACDVAIRGKSNNSLYDALTAAANKQGRVVTTDSHLEAGYFYRGDQFPFAKKGVPAVAVMPGQDLVVGGVEAGAKAYEAYIKERYHKPADRWSADWDLRGAALDIELLYRVGRDIANSNAWPEWYEDTEFKRIRNQSKAARGD